MDRAALVTELQAALGAAAKRFAGGPDDFGRHLVHAALDLGRHRPRTVLGTLALEAGRGSYPAPAELAAVAYPLWGEAERRRYPPWDRRHPGRLPRLRLAEEDGGRVLRLDPPPTGGQIGCLGADYPYYYRAAHVIGDSAAATTVAEADRGLLILRAMAEAMRELAAANVADPVQLHRGIASVPRSGTPAALHEALLQAFEREAR